MSLSFGRQFLAIPGPTTVPDVVLQAMHRPAIDIYEGELEGITERIRRDLKRVFRAQDDAETFIYIANGHGGWEAAVSNTMSRGDRILVLESGRFAVGWGEMASTMGVDVEVLPGRPRGGVDYDALEARLRADDPDRPNGVRAVLTVQIDTASSVHIDIERVRRAMDAAGHPAMLFVDGIASVGCVPFEMAKWGIDLAVTGSQKGLMTPPGLALMAVSPKAYAARTRADLVTRYWDWEFRQGSEHYQKYCGTPPEHLLFGLNRALDLLLEEEGLEAAWARHKALASAVRAAVAAWAEGGAVSFNILDPGERCDTVTMVRAEEGYEGQALRRFTSENLGLVLGSAIGGMGGPGGGFRIAHMGHANAASILGVIGAAETGMRALGWPVQGGAEAAVSSLSAVFS